jgi:hypothetical protein
MRLLLVVIAMGLLLGCAVEPVAAWERDYLARPEMAWDPDALSSSYRNHVHFSKEASSGGATAGGGGCGCN